MQNGLFRSLQLRAKAKMCANAEMICHEEYCTYAKDYGLKLARSQLVRSLIADDAHQDPDRIFHAAVQHELTPSSSASTCCPRSTSWSATTTTSSIPTSASRRCSTGEPCATRC
jgi:hypothetical protein